MILNWDRTWSHLLPVAHELLVWLVDHLLPDGLTILSDSGSLPMSEAPDVQWRVYAGFTTPEVRTCGFSSNVCKTAGVIARLSVNRPGRFVVGDLEGVNGGPGYRGAIALNTRAHPPVVLSPLR